MVAGPDYLALMQAIGELTPADNSAIALATAEGIERFSPPIFAAYCARDGLHCIQRLSEYKPLVAPIRYRIESSAIESILYIEGEETGVQLPAFVTEVEFALIVHLLRSATKQPIVPVNIVSIHPMSDALAALAGCPVETGEMNAITFTTADLHLPFISHHDGMWSYFEPELRRRLSQMDLEDSSVARVRAALVELLPAGENTIEDVSRKLVISVRTLQRQLSSEGTTFRQQLGHVRLLLAKQYLVDGDMSVDSIAFMLGYLETSSFVRAFTRWTGMSPAAYRGTTINIAATKSMS